MTDVDTSAIISDKVMISEGRRLSLRLGQKQLASIEPVSGALEALRSIDSVVVVGSPCTYCCINEFTRIEENY